MRRASFFVSLLAAAIVPSTAFAQDEVAPLPPPTANTTPSATAQVDAVYLRNGGLFRGRVTEIVPGDHVTVVVQPSGETKRIAWPEVDRVIVASTPIPPAPTTATPVPVPSTPEAPAPMVGPRARVHITASKQVILYRRAAGTSSFQQVCTSPCDMDLPIGDTYRLAGNGLSQNKELNLQAGPNGFVDIVVDPPSVGGMVIGGLLAGGGFTAAYIGLLMAGIGAASSSSSCYSYSSSSSTSCADKKDDSESVKNAGLVTLVVGLGAAVVGVIVFVNSATTDIKQHTSASAPKPSDAFVRKPEWRTVASSSEGAFSTPAAQFPLVFTQRF